MKLEDSTSEEEPPTKKDKNGLRRVARGSVCQLPNLKN
jgi:hypothetical protein